MKNNEPIPNRPYQTNFPTEGGGEYITAFQFLSADIAGGCCDHGNAISREDFPNRYTLISFDTSADFCPKAYFDPVDKGGSRLNLQFGSALTQAVNIIVYAEFNNLIEINGSRDVIHNFAEWEMNTSELEEILMKIDCTKITFGGVYPNDLLPLDMKQHPQSFVTVLTLVKNQEPIRWHFILLMINMVKFFDSCQLPPHRYTKYLEDFLNRNAAQWTYNRKHLRSLFTDVCGHYCIFYIYNRCHNAKMNTIVNMFPSKVKEDNDASVRYFVECKLVVREIVKPSSSLKLQCCKLLR